jgi:PAS domain S-box-containing protein
MIHELILNVALLVSFATLYSLLSRPRVNGGVWPKLLLGLFFGAIAMVGMTLPFHYAPGVIYDGRSIVMTLAGLFGGGPSALVAVLVAGAFRLYLGGNGVWAGVATIICCALVGYAFRLRVKEHTNRLTVPALYGIGLITQVVMLASQLLIVPWPAGLTVISRIWLPVISIFPAATVLMGILLRTEDRRLEAEIHLRESESRYRSLFDNNLDAILLTAPDGSIYAANPAACGMFGRTEEEICQLGREGIVDSSDPGVQAAIEERTRTGRFRGKLTYMRKDGSKFPAEISSVIFQDQKGLERTSMIIRDITERKVAEDTLWEREILLNAILSNLPITIFAIDSEGNFSLSEGKGLEAVGLKPGENVGESALELFNEMPLVEQSGELTNGNDVFQRVFAGESIHAHNKLRGAFLDNYIGPIQDKAGVVIGVVGVSINITERKLAEDALRHYNQELRSLTTRLSQVKEEERRVLALDLHDYVGQNLTALSINLNMLQSLISPESVEKIKPFLEDSQELIEQTTRHIRNLMVELRPPELDDYGLLAALRSYGDRFAQRNQIQIQVPVGDLNPQPSSQTATTLFHIAQEALTNIAKHAKASQVKITLSQVTNWLQMSIWDDGIGFDPETVPAGQAEIGWGLLSMKERAEAIGGHLRVKSHPGQGSTLIVEVPV